MLRDDINNAVKDAMRAKDERKLSTLRMVNSTIKNADIAARGEGKPPLSDADLGRTVTIRGEAHSVMQAINRQIAHYAYHCGQIVFLAKHLQAARWTAPTPWPPRRCRAAA